ncbi:MAG: hypothetical protein R3C01_10440 [Planctomycetaceae bacterium]
MLVGTYFVIVWGPACFVNDLNISPNGFRYRGGTWGWKQHDVVFSELESVQYSKRQELSYRFWNSHVYYITLNKKGGEKVEIKVDDLLEEGLRPLFVYARLGHVRYEDTTGQLSEAEVDELLKQVLNDDDAH